MCLFQRQWLGVLGAGTAGGGRWTHGHPCVQCLFLVVLVFTSTKLLPFKMHQNAHIATLFQRSTYRSYPKTNRWHMFIMVTVVSSITGASVSIQGLVLISCCPDRKVAPATFLVRLLLITSRLYIPIGNFCLIGIYGMIESNVLIGSYSLMGCKRYE